MNRGTHLSVLAFVPSGLRGSVTRALEPFALHVAFVASAVALDAHIESGCPEVVLVDTDLLGRPVDLCRLVRSLRADAKVIGLSCYWSDRDEALTQCLDAILHKPPRIAEWEATLRRLGFREVQPAAPAAEAHPGEVSALAGDVLVRRAAMGIRSTTLPRIRKPGI